MKSNDLVEAQLHSFLVFVLDECEPSC